MKNRNIFFSLVNGSNLSPKQKYIPVKNYSNVLSEEINIQENKQNQDTILSEKNNDDDLEFSSINELRTSMAKNIDLEFKKDATTMVFADGDPNSKIMIVGEAPGEEEDKKGKPFIGDSGKLLEAMFEAAHIKRKHMYITNVIPWRPPANRTPTKEEISKSQPYLLEHIRIINPKILVLVGSIAMKAFTNTSEAITKSRGIFKEHRNCLYIPIFHPSYLLRSPSKKKISWNDILQIKEKYKELI
ncbi:uracil-DNA glycosylase [Candidatus Nesciobacter abundans]|nr:uracil-DNA glycosylase [Candidatus Nesciobacter abundans]